MAKNGTTPTNPKSKRGQQLIDAAGKALILTYGREPINADPKIIMQLNYMQNTLLNNIRGKLTEDQKFLLSGTMLACFNLGAKSTQAPAQNHNPKPSTIKPNVDERQNTEKGKN